jgi:hypothetical protein
MDSCEKGGFIPGQALVRIAVSADASLEVRESNGANVVWLHAPLRCEEEWKVASYVAEFLNALAGTTPTCRIAEVIDKSAKTGSHSLVIYAYTESTLTQDQVKAAVASFFLRIVPQRGIDAGNLAKPALVDPDKVEAHAVEFIQRHRNKIISRPMLVSVGSEVVADVRGRWASGAAVDDPPVEQRTMLARFDGFNFSKRVIFLREKRRGFEVCFDHEAFANKLTKMCEDMQRLYKVVVERKVVSGNETLHLVQMEEADQKDLDTPLERHA